MRIWHACVRLVCAWFQGSWCELRLTVVCLTPRCQKCLNQDNHSIFAWTAKVPRAKRKDMVHHSESIWCESDVRWCVISTPLSWDENWTPAPSTPRSCRHKSARTQKLCTIYFGGANPASHTWSRDEQNQGMKGNSTLFIPMVSTYSPGCQSLMGYIKVITLDFLHLHGSCPP